MISPKTSLDSSNARNIANRLESISGGKVLDVATGNGDFIRTLMKTLKDYDSFTGIDISQKDLESARKNFENQATKFIEMNAEKMEFENDYFNTVCIANSLHHLNKIDLVLSEMKRVLKSEGYFIVQESFCDGEQTEAQKSEILSHHLDTEIDSLLGIPHKKTFTSQKIKDIISSIGLREVEVFESSRDVKCLFCDQWVKCEDPKNEDIVNFSIKGINESLNRLKNLKAFKKFQEKADKIKERIMKFGLASASILFFIGKK